jgi:hypothetical protein
MKPQYYFGQAVAKQLDFFAFPRTGSHLFRYCTQGLFDLVAIPTPGLNNPDAVERQREVNPLALYALDLREDGVPFSPVIIHGRPNGQHGAPIAREHPRVILVRDPIPTVYSYYRVQNDRWGWGPDTPRPREWVRQKLAEHAAFYAAARARAAEHPSTTLLLRYEDLTESPAPLERLVEFVGVRPKLSPAFVHRVTRFDFFAAPGERTFYRSGDNTAWERDQEWKDLIAGVEAPA